MLSRTRLRHWQLVIQVAALGSLQRGAAAVGMSQPAATQALVEIESLLGFPIFDRHSKGMRLTPAGESVLPRLRTAMASFADCAEAVSDVLAGGMGELRIGAINAALGGVLGRALVEFTMRQPAVAAHVVQQPPPALLVQLAEGSLDLLVVREPVQLPAQACFEPLGSDRYAVVCSRAHPLAGRAGVSLRELATQLWLTPPKSTVAEQDFLALWGDVEPPRQLCWVESRTTVLMWTLVERRQALAMVPFNTVRPWLDSGLLAEIAGPWGPALAPIGVVYRPGDLDPRGPGTQLLDCLRQCADLPLQAAPASAA